MGGDKMNKNNKYIKTAIFAAILTLYFILPVCSVFAGGKQEPRIEIITQKDSFGNERKKEIRFVDNKGKVTRKLPAKGLSVNAKRNYALQNVEPKTKPPKNRDDFFYFSKSLLNIKGKEKWNKTYKTFPLSRSHDVIDYHYACGIADSIGSVYINYRDSLGQYHIEVIDSTGEMIFHIDNAYWFYDIQISPDATTLKALTYNEKNEDLILVFDINLKTNKMFKSRCADWGVDVYLKENYDIYLMGHFKGERFYFIVKYDQLSEDLSQVINENYK
jgi:hypothetical protein